MIRRRRSLIEFERRYAAEHPPDHAKSLRIFEAMVREAVALGALSPDARLEGIESDMELARKLKGVRGTPPADQP